MKKVFTIVGLLMALFSNAQIQLLKIADDKRSFATADGNPFFWLGDTGWLLFVRTTREDAVHYLDVRKQQGFNVIQAMVLHDLNNTKNVYGDSALVNLDVAKPKVTKGNNFKNEEEYDYWDHVDFIVDEAAKRGLYMALVPVWGSNVKGGKVNVQQAETYGKFLAERYKNKTNIIWLNGGDVKGTEGLESWIALAKTIKKYDTKHLMTFHPRGRYSSSEWFHNEDWLDFNMFQSGHKDYAQDTSSKEKYHFGEDNYKYLQIDYAMKPTKPSFDGEPSYENIPHGLHDSLAARWTAADIRRYAYWCALSGGAGFTYGENSMMQFKTNWNKDVSYGPVPKWKESIYAKGATQMQFVKQLMTKYNFAKAKPAQEILINNTGDKYDYLIASKAANFALVYTYTGKQIDIDASKLGFVPNKANWYNPSTGKTTAIEKLGKKETISFKPIGEVKNGNDWILILSK